MISFFVCKRETPEFLRLKGNKGACAFLRLAEFAFLREALGRIPLILADDVLGELDNLRKANFRKLLPAEAQVFATGTSYPSQSESAIWETFEVLAGNFKENLVHVVLNGSSDLHSLDTTWSRSLNHGDE